MKKCKHENADHLMLGDAFIPCSDSPLSSSLAQCEQFRCLDCGEWLSLGPSNDIDMPHDERTALVWFEQGFGPFENLNDCPCNGCAARWLVNAMMETP